MKLFTRLALAAAVAAGAAARPACEKRVPGR
jgi:hypothetical protein